MNGNYPTYLIAAALVWKEGQILLVQQQGPGDPFPSWALPGGVVEPGELLTEALVREVYEETGLVVVARCYLYSVQVEDPGNHQRSLGFVFEADYQDGPVRPEDPDGFVLDARFLPMDQAISLLEELPWRVMREPILACIKGEVGPGAVWLYRQGPDQHPELVARIIG